MSVPFLQAIHADPIDFRRFTNQGLVYELESTGFSVDQVYGSYGVFDTLEYLLFGTLVWKVNDALGASHGLKRYLKKEQKTRVLIWEAIKGLMKREGALGIIYILLIAIFFVIFKVMAIIFDSMQKRDIHHATSFSIICHKAKMEKTLVIHIQIIIT